MQAPPLFYLVEHVVQPDETLCSIAIKYYGDKSRRHDIYVATKALLLSDFDPINLPVGMVVNVPYPTQGIQED
jgi:nucleoid-associated protein YgaU